MEKQLSFSEFEYASKTKKTKKEKFLEEMSAVLPWSRWCEIIQPFYFLKGNGREPTPLITMLKMYLLSLWYNISDEILEDTIHDSMSFKNFIGTHVPDATTLCRFRRMLEKNKLNKKIFTEEVEVLKENGMIREHGTIVDASIIHAGASKKNKDKKANPEMSSVKKGNQWHFGMKSHIGVDEDSGLVHSAVATIAKEHDLIPVHKCLHGKEKRIRGDSGYVGIEKRAEVCEKLHDGTGEIEIIKTKIKNKATKLTVHKKRDVEFIINKRASKITQEDKPQEYAKSKIRAKVEHIFLILKHIFGFRKVRLRTITANEERLYMYYSLVNIYKISRMQHPPKTSAAMQLLAA